MIGTTLNVAGIIVGGIVGLTRNKPVSIGTQNYLKIALGILTGFFGLWLAWISLRGPFLHVLKQLGLVVAALAVGRLTGRLLHLQKSSNRLGRFARTRINAARPGNPDRFSEGFQVCAALFCAAPLGVAGAVSDGLSGYFFPLAVKAVMDGLATMGFVSMFGWGVMLSAVPVLVFQGTITLFCARFVQPFLEAHGGLVDPVNLTAGLLIFCVALIVLEIKRIQVTDYLPSLVFAPLFAWWIH